MSATKTPVGWSEITRIEANEDNWDHVEESVKHLFGYQKWTPEQEEAGTNVRETLESAFVAILAHVPPGPTRTDALRDIYNARMKANAAITHQGSI